MRSLSNVVEKHFPSSPTIFQIMCDDPKLKFVLSDPKMFDESMAREGEGDFKNLLVKFIYRGARELPLSQAQVPEWVEPYASKHMEAMLKYLRDNDKVPADTTEADLELRHLNSYFLHRGLAAATKNAGGVSELCKRGGYASRDNEKGIFGSDL